MRVVEKLGELNLPVEVSCLVPTKCSSCGYDYEVNDSLSFLGCGNPFCLSKLVERSVSMMDFLAIVGYGRSFFYHYFRVSGSEFVSSLFVLTDASIADLVSKYGSILEGGSDSGLTYSVSTFNSRLSSFKDDIDRVKASLTLVKYVKALNIPNIQSRADDMFSRFSTYSDFHSRLTSLATEDEFADLLGVSSTSYEVMANLVGSLSVYTPDLLNYESMGGKFYVGNRDGVLRVVCSKSVGGNFRSKNEFYRYVEERFSSKVTIKWLSSVTSKADLVLWGGVDGSESLTSKVLRACEYNRRGIHIPIISASRFIDILGYCSDFSSIRDTVKSLDFVDYSELDY